MVTKYRKVQLVSLCLALEKSIEVASFTLPGNKFYRYGPVTEKTTFFKSGRLGRSWTHESVVCGRPKTRMTLNDVDVDSVITNQWCILTLAGVIFYKRADSAWHRFVESHAAIGFCLSTAGWRDRNVLGHRRVLTAMSSTDWMRSSW